MEEMRREAEEEAKNGVDMKAVENEAISDLLCAMQLAIKEVLDCMFDCV
jgi:hypothetical protein